MQMMVGAAINKNGPRSNSNLLDVITVQRAMKKTKSLPSTKFRHRAKGGDGAAPVGSVKGIRPTPPTCT